MCAYRCVNCSQVIISQVGSLKSFPAFAISQCHCQMKGSVFLLSFCSQMADYNAVSCDWFVLGEPPPRCANSPSMKRAGGERGEKKKRKKDGQEHKKETAEA